MRTEIIYSVAALVSFPIVVNAEAVAVNVGKITAAKDGTAWTKDCDLVSGKYTFKNTVNATGTTGKKATVEILNGSTSLKTAEVEVGKTFSVDFELTGAATVTLKVTSEVAEADFVADNATVELNFLFSKTAELLKIEYNKVTQVLAEADYENKAADAQEYSKLYDRVIAIANGSYDVYKEEGLDAIYNDAANVAGLSLYSDIANALTDVKNKELALLDGDKNLGGLNTRYDKLDHGFGINYVTSALKTKKNAANTARDTFDSEPTAANLTAVKEAIAAYEIELKKEEEVKDVNEEANTALVNELAKVYGGTESYYTNALAQIAAQYTAPRYSDLKTQVEAELAAIVGSTDYTTVEENIKSAYKAKKSKEKTTDLINEIAGFKEKLTRKVSDYSTVRGQLNEVYDKYDAQKKAADELTAGAADFLLSYKSDVDSKVAAFLTFIETNDQFATVANLTEDAVNEKIATITAAKETYKAQAAIYKDYTDLKAAVNAKTTALNTAKTDVDKYAKDTKKLDAATFKPTTIWATTISAIDAQISSIDTKVENNKTDATNYKTKKEYTDAMSAIDTAISKFKANANEATDRYATIAAQIKTAKDLQDALLDANKEPKVDLTTLNVWSNQVTIDDAIKARTPYKKFINSTDGTITTAIAGWETNLAAAPSKTIALNAQGNNDDNILAYLKKLASDASSVLSGEIKTMNDIKANYQTDEQKFQDQIDQQECAGLITMINDKAEVFEPLVKVLQDAVNANPRDISNAHAALLQKEIDKINAKIDAATGVAAKAGATKTELTAAYDSIKDLETTDIKTAQELYANYQASFAAATDKYNTLVGTASDASTASTLNGLTKKVKEQKDAIGALANLTDAQKNSLKGKVDAVKVVKSEGDPAADVTYTISSVKEKIEADWQNEKLDAAAITKYQGIINELKDATNAVKTQADNLNNLEGQLKGIDLAKAKKDILAKDSNADGFYVKQLTGKYTNDFNNLKSKIEADEDITAAEVTSYGTEISTLKSTIEGLPAKAKTNLDKFNAAKNAYNDAVTKYGEYVKDLNDNYQTSQLQAQLAVLETLKEALDEKYTGTVVKDYNDGTAADADKTAITDKFNEIKQKYDEFTNIVNYQSQIAADNKAIYDAINAAHAAADAQYAISSSIVNTYKLFKSEELKAAAEKAQAELQALLTYLEGYDAKVADIQKRADEAYSGVVSPDKFDTDETYKAEFDAVNEELKAKTQALSDKIKEFGAPNVTESVELYTTAITTSKEKVVKFSATDADLTDDQMSAIYGTIDDMLKAINDTKDDDTKLQQLDAALVAAANGSTGIINSILQAERNQASSQLNVVITAYGNTEYQNNLSLFTYGDEYYEYRNIYRDAAGYNGNTGYDRCVSNFSNYKQRLAELKVIAEQNKADWTAINNTQNVISAANTALSTLVTDYQNFVAGYNVKTAVEQIAAELSNYPSSAVTKANSDSWKEQVEAIYKAAFGTTPESGKIITVYNNLYDKEIVVIDSLINKAKEENLTYGDESDRTTMSGLIDGQKTSFEAVKKAVNDGDKTKKDALKLNLKNIELALNGYLKTMKDGNETNTDEVVKQELLAQVNTQDNELYNAMTNLNEYVNSYYYTDIYYRYHYYYVTNALRIEKSRISSLISDLQTYISNHANEMLAYKPNAEAMLAEISTAITTLKSNAQEERTRQEEEYVYNDEYNVIYEWSLVQNLVTYASGTLGTMNKQLSLYGSADTYKNKVNQLQAQYNKAEGYYNEYKGYADETTTLRTKYNYSQTAKSLINSVLTSSNFDDNCSAIIALAKAAYIDARIAALNAQIIEDTWTASANYTATDKSTLTTMWNALKTSVTTLKTNAEAQGQAEITYNYWGGISSLGVIETLDRGEEQFNTDLAALKQALKDMSLAEDVKGHVSGNDDITTDDLMDLADIILNGEEDSANMDACDVNGDGEIDVTDLVWLRYYLVHEDWPQAAAAARTYGNSSNSDAIELQTTSAGNGITRLAVNLSNEETYKAFQISMQLPAGAKVVAQSLGERVEGANLLSKENNGVVTFIGLSTANNIFSGNNGAVLYVDVEGLNGEVVLGKAIFTTVDYSSVKMGSNEATGIRESIANAFESAGKSIYNLGGKMMNGLKKGINIIRNADGTATKVVKK